MAFSNMRPATRSEMNITGILAILTTIILLLASADTWGNALNTRHVTGLYQDYETIDIHVPRRFNSRRISHEITVNSSTYTIAKMAYSHFNESGFLNDISAGEKVTLILNDADNVIGIESETAVYLSASDSMAAIKKELIICVGF